METVRFSCTPEQTHCKTPKSTTIPAEEPPTPPCS